MSTAPAYTLTVLNDSDRHLYFTLFSYDKKTLKKNRISILSEGGPSNECTVSCGTFGTFRWPVAMKMAFDSNLAFNIVASESPIYGSEDTSSALATTTISFPRYVFDLKKVIKFTDFENREDIRMLFHCTSREVALHSARSNKINQQQQSILSGVLKTAFKWEQHKVLKIRFQDYGRNAKEVRNKVLEHIGEWLKHTNLTCKRIKGDYEPEYTINSDDSNDEEGAESQEEVVPVVWVGEQADIYIGFEIGNTNGDNWSVIGSDSLRYTARGQLSMNLAGCNISSLRNQPVEFRRIVLHEFGHALGLDHEHQSPRSGMYYHRGRTIEWYRELFPERVNTTSDENIWLNFSILDPPGDYILKEYDPDSIMTQETLERIQMRSPEDGYMSDGSPWPAPRRINVKNVLSEGDKHSLRNCIHQCSVAGLALFTAVLLRVCTAPCV